MLLTLTLFTIGLFLIIKGSDWFIEAAINTAKATGISEVLIGATVVSFGTTLPELFVSSSAALQGYPEMSVGNAIGSIICNTGLILGLCNIISPSKIYSRIFNMKALILVVYMFTFYLLSLDGIIYGFDSFILILALLLYLFVNYMETNIQSNHRRRINSKNYLNSKFILKNLSLFCLGSIMVCKGADLLIDNGVILADYLNIPNIIISLTVFGLGTSLPELSTSLSALIKGHHNISIGNILGANLLNICLVIGISSIITPLPISSSCLYFHMPICILLILILIVPTVKSWGINRKQAFFLLLIYILYLIYNYHVLILE